MTSSFVIYDNNTGKILKSVNISGSPADVKAMIAANSQGGSVLTIQTHAPPARTAKVVNGVIETL